MHCNWELSACDKSHVQVPAALEQQPAWSFTLLKPSAACGDCTLRACSGCSCWCSLDVQSADKLKKSSKRIKASTNGFDTEPGGAGKNMNGMLLTSSVA